MRNLAPRRSVLAAIAVATAMVIALPAFLPNPSSATEGTEAPRIVWRQGQTHSVRENPRNRELTMVIFLQPTRDLHEAYRLRGIRGTQDLLWDSGQPPRFSACASWGPCVQQNYVSQRIRGWIYGQPMHLREAVLRAQRTRGCLALTLIRQNRRVAEWTAMSGRDCVRGRLPVGGT